jgi:hypothetical protein|tara:strand:+ start:1686 stop:1853 length:168 start_codon:yes stop_codon:yes gene_type:complete
MYDAWAKFTTDAAQTTRVIEQSIDQRATCVAGCGVHDHPRGFIDYDDVGVFVNDV